MSTHKMSNTQQSNDPQSEQQRAVKSSSRSFGSNPRIAFVIAVASPLFALFFLLGRRELGLEQAQIPAEVLTLNSVQANDRIRGDLNAGQQITVHFAVWLAHFTAEGPVKGKLIDSTRQSDKPFTFTLGSGQVFQGWDKAIAPMQLGEKRTVYIPAQEAYGKEGIRGKIPPNSGLILEVEVLERSQ